ncbi:MAG TPA: hypothetical protein VH969_27770 [Actinophytocola sp.]|jgi:vacuolar-type H+-ATPase subunit E/Vma4|uniref:hypothetical protein n=1 Tax=Actinophytocola sp. TaxID=1872138 RepID=UPI002F9229AE
MTPLVQPQPAEALRPLRAELLRRARTDADRTREDAAATAAETLATARERAAEILAEAEARGEDEAAELRSARLARVRRGLRADELAAQRAVYDELSERVTEAVCRLRQEPGYEDLRDHLADAARRVLGEDTVVTEAPGGGILAARRGHRLDYSLTGFAARAVARLGADVSGLWTV